MKPTYFLGIDVAKHKIRAALLCAPERRTCFERDLPVSAAGRRELLARLRQQVSEPNQLLVLIEATETDISCGGRESAWAGVTAF